jgi:hypothetical protein
MLLMMSGEAPETCQATHKRQVINLRNNCILLVDLFESMTIIIGQTGGNHGSGGCVTRKLSLGKRLKNSECQVVVATKFCMTAPTICGPSVCNLLLVIILPPKILRLFLDFLKICALLYFLLRFNRG